MNKKPLKDPKGGLTPAGRKAFGGNLKPGVKNYSTASVSDKKRWISWALRFYGQDNYPPLKKPNGEPTRFALTAAAWGEPVPSTEAEARAIAAKARKRKQELANQEVSHTDNLTVGVSMNPDVEAFLQHYGKKGMKWGVRRQIKKANPSEKKVAKLDAKWERKVSKSGTIIKVWNGAAKTVNVKIDELNNSPKYKGKDLTKNPKLLKQYDDDMSKIMTKALNDTSAKVVGSSASKKKLEFTYDMNDGMTWRVREGNG